jgi:uncharacterized protein YbjT (DUF2867 family)
MQTGRWTVVVAGATGLVGRQAVAALAADNRVSEVRALVRPGAGLAAAWPPGVRVCPVDWGRLEASADALAADAVLCALGTTMRQAGSRAAFRQVDHDHVLALARLARQRGARAFGVVSALGADAGSLFFYNRVKGEMEAGLRAMDWPHLVIARPSLLLGERRELRWREALAQRFGGLMPHASKPVHAADVARSWVVRTLQGLERPQGVCVLTNREMRAFGRG